MRKMFQHALCIVSMTSVPAMAHVGYTGRNFGTFEDSYAVSTLGNQAVTGSYGWIDGTDADYGDAHKTLAYRFTLLNPTNVTLSFENQAFASPTPGGTPALAGLLPGFSLFQGLAHVKPMGGDYDSSDISKAHRPAGTEGAFRALSDWNIGNDPDTVNRVPAALSFFKHIGHAYDGTGFGSDGVADGRVSHTFTNLAAGDYSVFIGGSDYLAQEISNPNLLGKYGVTGTLVAGVVPEPETYAMLLAGLGLIGAILRKRRRWIAGSAISTSVERFPQPLADGHSAETRTGPGYGNSLGIDDPDPARRIATGNMSMTWKPIKQAQLSPEVDPIFDLTHYEHLSRRIGMCCEVR